MALRGKFALLALALLIPVFGPARLKADILWDLSAVAPSKNHPSNSTLATTLAPHVRGTDGDAYGASEVGLLNGRFDTVITSSGAIFIRHGVPSGTTLDYSKGFVEFGITAESGYLLYLDSLDFRVATDSHSVFRSAGFELFGVANGIPAASDLLLDIDDVRASVNAPQSVSVDLSGAEFQGVDSVTFRFYPLVSTANLSVYVDGWTVNGSVVPIPESTAGTLAGLLLAVGWIRRRRPAMRR